jgi:hypothetical protein
MQTMDNLSILPHTRLGWLLGLTISLILFTTYYLPPFFLYEKLQNFYNQTFWDSAYQVTYEDLEIKVRAPKYIASFVQREMIISVQNKGADDTEAADSVPVYEFDIVVVAQHEGNPVILPIRSEFSNSGFEFAGSNVIPFGRIPDQGILTRQVWVRQPLSYSSTPITGTITLSFFILEPNKTIPTPLVEITGSNESCINNPCLIIDPHRTIQQSLIQTIMLPPWSNGFLVALALLFAWAAEVAWGTLQFLKTDREKIGKSFLTLIQGTSFILACFFLAPWLLQFLVNLLLNNFQLDQNIENNTSQPSLWFWLAIIVLLVTTILQYQETLQEKTDTSTKSGVYRNKGENVLMVFYIEQFDSRQTTKKNQTRPLKYLSQILGQLIKQFRNLEQKSSVVSNDTGSSGDSSSPSVPISTDSTGESDTSPSPSDGSSPMVPNENSTQENENGDQVRTGITQDKRNIGKHALSPIERCEETIAEQYEEHKPENFDKLDSQKFLKILKECRMKTRSSSLIKLVSPRYAAQLFEMCESLVKKDLLFAEWFICKELPHIPEDDRFEKTMKEIAYSWKGQDLSGKGVSKEIIYLLKCPWEDEITGIGNWGLDTHIKSKKWLPLKMRLNRIAEIKGKEMIQTITGKAVQETVSDTASKVDSQGTIDINNEQVQRKDINPEALE